MTIDDIKREGLLLLECISGSKAYGLNTPRSDTDIKGVFYLPRDRFYGLNYIDQINNETNDEVYYELGRFITLLAKNNPNILELLATPDDCILFQHPVMRHLSMDLFISQLCKETFGNYAVTQIKKARGLNKKMLNPVDKERKVLLDFCYVIQGKDTLLLKDWLKATGSKQELCGLSVITHARGMYALHYDATDEHNYNGIIRKDTANEVCLSSIPKGVMPDVYLYCNQDGYSVYCREYREYREWVENRNEIRYTGNMAHGGDYDAKNLMHTVRLLQVAEEIGRTGKLTVRRPNREELLRIKAGEYSYDALLQMADEWSVKVEHAFAVSALPVIPDKAVIEKTLVTMRKELYC